MGLLRLYFTNQIENLFIISQRHESLTLVSLS